MSQHQFRQNRDEIKELLNEYCNLKEGKPHSFIDEEAFESIIDYFCDLEELAKAIEAANYGIERYPYSSALQIKKADLLIADKKYAEALKCLQQAEVFDNRNIDVYILKTDAYLALDQQEKAAYVLEEALNYFEGEDKLDLLFELADVYDDYENFDKVFDCLKMILEIDPTNDEALNKICFWTDFTGRADESIQLHQQIINEHPYNELAWFNLGSAYQGLKLYEKAIDAYKYATAIEDKFDYAWRNIGDAYIRIRKYKDAIEALQKVLEVSRPEEVIYEAIGYCYEKLKNHAQARFNYRKATHLNQENSRLFYKIAVTYMHENVWDSALRNLEIALRLKPKQAEFYLAYGQCFIATGNIEKAIENFVYAIKLKPKNMYAWTEILKCLFDTECFEEGVYYSDLALQSTNSKPIFYFYKTAFLLETGKRKEALLTLMKGMQQNPKLLKKLVNLSPAVLQNQSIIEVIAKFKKQKDR